MAASKRRYGCRFASLLALFVAMMCFLGFPCGGELSLAGRPVSELAYLSREVASVKSNPAMAEAKGLVCEAVFSGSFPVLSKLAELKVSVEEFRAQSKPELAQMLYDSWRRKIVEAGLSGIDLAGLRFLIEEASADRETERQSKKDREKRVHEIEESKLINGSKVVFHTMAPGKFMMGELGKQVETELTKPFQMAATQTTQLVWRKVALRAKEKFPGKYDALDVNPSKFEGDLRPVEQISWEDTQLWLNALNELAASGDAIVEEAMPGHKPGEIYGLPTEAEWEFVVRARGEADGKYHFGENEADLGDFAWFGGNSAHQTHPVAQKKPLVIDGQEFYDMHGNVSEWVHDWYRINLQGGVDPRGPDGGDAHTTRGGSWFDGAPSILRSGCRGVGMPESRYAYVGFRLVRR